MPVPNKSQVPIGTVLEGKFRITCEIGRGGMAAVYEAENIDIGKRVAVKILAAELITSRIVRERFIREARAAAAINSPYICDVYDSGMFEERPFLVMELLEGESLYDMLTRLRQLDFETTLRICTHAARGLGKAHEANVVHRDLKPENIFITKNEEGLLLAKILDFGLAKFYEPTSADAQTARLTREGALFGTPAYMSPEQAKGQGEVDHRADLWALGCIVYECLTGQTVWNVEQGVAMILAQIAGAPLPRPSKLRPDLPESFDAWFYRALNRDPNQRFQTAREFADALAEALVVKEQARKPELSSDVEASVIDELISNELANQKAKLAAKLPPATPPIAWPASESPKNLPLPPPAVTSPTTEPPKESSSMRAIALLFVVAAVALGGYAAWLYVLHPPGGGELASSATSQADAGAKITQIKRSNPDAYKTLLEQAQDQFEADPRGALETFKAAFQSGSAPAARSLLSHATVAVEEAKGPCKVTAISRPRPYEFDQAVSRPSIIETAQGALLAWVDNHADPKRRQAFTVQLDRALRRKSDPQQTTPEATSVRQPEIRKAGDKVLLVYWDEGGKEPAVYFRQLDAQGKIAGPAQRLSNIKSGDMSPAVTAADDGGFWVTWTEQVEPQSTDLLLRKIRPNFEAEKETVRLTAFAPQRGTGTRAATPDVTVAHGKLYVAFSLELDPRRRQVMLLSVPLADLAEGLEFPKPGARAPQRKNSQALGTLMPLSTPHSRNTQARVACTAQGCFVAWDDEKGGASIAFVERDKPQKLWSREFTSKGASPAVMTEADHALLAWFDESRLKMAPVTRDGLGAISVVNRVNGFQPTPSLVPGSKAGEWLISWRDYEAAHLELFALRAVCR
jgi:serine/threonine protein kinase